MEEAEVLCHRIGIMAKGTLRCLGPQLRLKEVYGSGFKITFSAIEENMVHATNYIESLLPPGFVKVDSWSTTTTYEFQSSPGAIANIFGQIEENAEIHGISDW